MTCRLSILVFFIVALSSGYGQKPEELLNNMRSLSPMDMSYKKYHKKILTFYDAPSQRIIENYMQYSAKLSGMNLEQYYKLLDQYKKLLSGFSFDVFTAMVSNSGLNKCGFRNYTKYRREDLPELIQIEESVELNLYEYSKCIVENNPQLFGNIGEQSIVTISAKLKQNLPQAIYDNNRLQKTTTFYLKKSGWKIHLTQEDVNIFYPQGEYEPVNPRNSKHVLAKPSDYDNLAFALKKISLKQIKDQDEDGYSQSISVKPEITIIERTAPEDYLSKIFTGQAQLVITRQSTGKTVRKEIYTFRFLPKKDKLLIENNQGLSIKKLSRGKYDIDIELVNRDNHLINFDCDNLQELCAVKIETESEDNQPDFREDKNIYLHKWQWDTSDCDDDDGDGYMQTCRLHLDIRTRNKKEKGKYQIFYRKNGRKNYRLYLESDNVVFDRSFSFFTGSFVSGKTGKLEGAYDFSFKIYNSNNEIVSHLRCEEDEGLCNKKFETRQDDNDKNIFPDGHSFGSEEDSYPSDAGDQEAEDGLPNNPDKQHIEKLYAKADSLKSNHRYEAAGDAYVHVLEMDNCAPYEESALIRGSEAYFFAGQYLKAIHMLDEFKDKGFTEHKEYRNKFLYLSGVSHYKKSNTNYEKVLEFLEQINNLTFIEKYRNQIYRIMAHCYEELEQWADAVNKLEQVVPESSYEEQNLDERIENLKWKEKIASINYYDFKGWYSKKTYTGRAGKKHIKIKNYNVKQLFHIESHNITQAVIPIEIKAAHLGDQIIVDLDRINFSGPVPLSYCYLDTYLPRFKIKPDINRPINKDLGLGIYFLTDKDCYKYNRCRFKKVGENKIEEKADDYILGNYSVKNASHDDPIRIIVDVNYMGKRWNKLDKLGKDKKVSDIKLLLVLSSAHHMVAKDIIDAYQKYKKVTSFAEFINFLNNF